MLHDVGSIMWHNVPKLKNMVVINPQWLADAMAGVVSFMSQGATAASGGMTTWRRIQESLKLKYGPPHIIFHLYLFPIFRFPDFSVHETAISLLEYFEIIYRMRMGAEQTSTDTKNEEQMFYVPSLLSPISADTIHPALTHWNRIEPKYVHLMQIVLINRHFFC